jgi:hypothetical protein
MIKAQKRKGSIRMIRYNVDDIQIEPKTILLTVKPMLQLKVMFGKDQLVFFLFRWRQKGKLNYKE